MISNNGQQDQKAKMHVDNVVMIFGKSPKKEALPMFQQGASKEEVLKKTGHVVGVAGATFTVKEGEIFVVMGLSGSGKSTLIRCLNRLIEPTSGHVYIDGEDVLAADKNRLREIRRTKMGMVFQHFALLPHKTVAENVAYGLKIRGVDEHVRREEAIKSLDLVGLKEWADRYPHNLSGGMKQRVGLARALATDPDILLMDEAFSALDPLIRRQMQNEMLNLQERLRKTIIFITHDLNEALRVGNHIAVMRDGAIVQIGTPIQIVTEPADDYVAAFTQDVDQGRVLTAEYIMKPAEMIMLKPDELGRGHSVVDKILKRMDAMDDASALYIVNHKDELQGVLRKKRLVKAMEDDSVGHLSQVIEQDFPRTIHTTSLTEIYALCADGVPIAVLDAAGRLQGSINPVDVLMSLASQGENENGGGLSFGKQESKNNDTVELVTK